MRTGQLEYKTLHDLYVKVNDGISLYVRAGYELTPKQYGAVRDLFGMGKILGYSRVDDSVSMPMPVDGSLDLSDLIMVGGV